MSTLTFSLRTALFGTVSAFPFLVMASGAMANPLGGEVEAGEATIQEIDPSTLEVTQQSDRAIINWDSFDIGEDETTRFVVPESSSVTLNRDFSGDPSEILGTLESNGQVFLVNRSGILFGENAVVDVSGLVATTHDIRSEDFMRGDYDFSIPGNPAAGVINQGSITVDEMGFGAFVAPHVRNDGAIVARLGTVELAAANGFTLDLHGDNLISFLVESPNEHQILDPEGNPVTGLVENGGSISAEGGHVVLSAAAARGVIDGVINTDGIIEANTVAEHEGTIVLGGGDNGVVQVDGTISAQGDDAGETGGTVTVTGQYVGVTENAVVDASGQSGGGRIMVGGDYLGGQATDERLADLGIDRAEDEVPTAEVTVVAAGAHLAADAVEEGDGGVIVTWADETNVTWGTLTARGGEEGGDGGFVETSAENLQFSGRVDVSAPSGLAGTWLLDPLNITIDELDEANADWTSYIGNWGLRDGGFYDAVSIIATDRGAVVPVDPIEDALDAGANVIITTWGTSGSQSGDIRLRTDIRVRPGGGARLGLFADDDVRIDSGVDIRSTGGPLILELFALTGDIDADNIGRIDLDGGELILQFEDGVEMSSNYDMDDTLTLYVLNEDLGSRRRTVDIEFDNDRVYFTYTGDEASFFPYAIDLRDSSANGHLDINFDGDVEARLRNYAFIWDDDHSWNINGVENWGVEQINALDGEPEFVAANSLSLRSRFERG